MKTRSNSTNLVQDRSANCKSVLRYPGGKRRLLPMLRPYMRHLLDGETCLLDGFIGGGSVTVWAASYYPNLKLVACDKDEFVAAFWQIIASTIEDARRLCAALDVTPTLDLFDRMQERMVSPETLDTVEKAALAVQSSRFTYSGIQGGGPFGGRHQTGTMRIGSRYNVDALCRGIFVLHGLLGDRLTAWHADALELIPQYPDVPCFCDPPYVSKGDQLYRTGMSPGEHARLADVLRQRERWLLTYDNHPVVRSLYEGWAAVDTIPASYSGSRGNDNRQRQTRELVIFPCGTKAGGFCE